ncbi:hypothetical protein G5I_04143 [Acromyrmex echinatior]|uniref:Uncharacterized protein n=1 Tax=Acromyrmex echinatior TaxID=103372 RepID=F4WEU4_ACREC|nr:hypothetical protein G5I_04143 [Acromyrmex echinatior]
MRKAATQAPANPNQRKSVSPRRGHHSHDPTRRIRGRGRPRQNPTCHEIGITNLRAKRAITDAEVRRSDEAAKPNVLTACMREVVGEREGIRIIRSVRCAELRASSLDDNISGGLGTGVEPPVVTVIGPK